MSDTKTIGRFAPSPTGVLHLGNLRTALAAWASACSVGGTFFVRFEDLDQFNASAHNALRQAEDLSALGISSDSTPVFQSHRFEMYHDAISDLVARGLTYECFCTRKEIQEAVAAPHGVVGVYPGTCRELSATEREQRRAERPSALRLLSGGVAETFTDYVHGTVTGIADDIVLRRNDGVPSYNVAVVVDDAAQGVTEVVRGEDLLDVTASQVRLQRLLGLPQVTYGHVPLVVGADGERLAKRHGAVTLYELEQSGMSVADVREMLWASLGQTGSGLSRGGLQFDWELVPREPFFWSGK